ncbi:hypothetical protein HAX54_020718 [Datura stramonium]|uniref:Uncharacterized protein n=1 Tax=Datura stramonium TaxID=4076 RepID=A0ABS8UUH8_DATST|nr:hypothetical protein [Datura stramonium]
MDGHISRSYDGYGFLHVIHNISEITQRVLFFSVWGEEGVYNLQLIHKPQLSIGKCFEEPCVLGHKFEIYASDGHAFAQAVSS